ncbi:hypothetical protein MHYP_G00088360 [Metynnis hypsauchen]
MGGASSQGKPECTQGPRQFILAVQREEWRSHFCANRASRGSPVTPRTTPSSKYHPNLQADWQQRAASLQAPLSGSPRRNLKPPSLTPCHILTTNSSPEGFLAPKLHPQVAKRPKLDINSDALPV